MKCKRCGKGVGLVRRGQPIADGYICFPCLDELGFDKKCRGAKRWTLAYWEIKDGPDRIHYNQAARKGKHEDWLEAHPEYVSLIEGLDEGNETESDEAVEIDENQED